MGIEPSTAPSGRTSSALLGLDRRLNAVRPAAVVGHAAGELVDEFDTAGAHDVVAVAREQHLGVERHVDRRERQVLFRVVQRAASEQRLRVTEAGVGERDVALVLVDAEVGAGRQPADRLGDRAGTGSAAPPSRRR